jgi:hypothetical protein
MLTVPHRRTSRVLSAALLVLAMVASVWFGLRTYGTFRLLQSAQLLGRPQVSSVRGWMTHSYVSDTYHVPIEQLMNGLNLPVDTAKDSSLKSLSVRQGMMPFSYVSRVQHVIAGLLRRHRRAIAKRSFGRARGFFGGAWPFALARHGWNVHHGISHRRRDLIWHRTSGRRPVLETAWEPGRL